jgi:uncharacterized SAM-binding protein YcdF (DUF218 family)
VRLAPDGGIRPAYRCRLDRARALHAEGLDIVVLGGATRPGAPTEAAAGAAYLIARGVPAGAIRTEAASRHTLENLRLYRSHAGDALQRPVALVSSRFHLARSALIASGLRLPHQPCAAEARRLPAPADIARLAREAFLIHWYVVGRGFARLAGNRRMLARIS